MMGNPDLIRTSDRGSQYPLQVWGYIPDFDVPTALASAQANRAILTGVTLVRYHLSPEGELVEYAGIRPSLPSVAGVGLPVVPLIANQLDGQWRPHVVGAILADPARRRSHVEQIVACVLQEQYPAVEMDYEFLPAELRVPFSAFLDELAGALHARGRQLAVAVHAKRSEPGEAGGPSAQDWARIGAAADRVAVMTYDFNPSTPGPIAPIEWTREVLRFAVSCIPPDKVIQGIPLYGYRWEQGAAPAYLTHQEFAALARRHHVTPKRDAEDRYLVLGYEVHGAPAEAWLPDHQTVGVLAEVGREVGVAGYSVWRLGSEEPSALASL